MYENLIKLKSVLNYNQKKNLIFITLLMFLTILAEVFSLNVLFVLLSFFSNPDILNSNLFFNKIYKFSNNFNFETFIITIFLLSFLFKSLMTILISWYENKFFANTEKDLALKLFNGYISMPKIFHLRTNISETVKVITFEVQHLIYAIRSISTLTMEILMLLGLTTFLLFINFKVTILTFSILLIFSFILHFLNSKPVNSMGKSRVVFTKNRLQNIIEGVSGAKIFQLTGTEKKIISDFETQNNGIAKIVHHVGFRLSLPRTLFEILVLFLTVFIIFFALQSNIEMKNLIPVLGVFLTAGYRMVPSFGRILSSLHRMSFSLQAIKKIYIDHEKFKTNNSIIEKEIKIDNVFSKNLKILNLNFSYEKNQKSYNSEILQNLSLDIKKGDKIGIIGKSGSGKSTLVDLIIGFLDPSSGKIYVDEIELIKIKKQWQKIIGCVPQEVFIMDKSLAENIAFSFPKDKIDFKHLDKCIKEANIEDLKQSLKFGVNTIMGEKGARLSGGQRQRIGIARALYNKPEILIFDEATSSLDEKTEEKIIDEVFKTYFNKTIIFVSHNINNLRYCNKLIEISNKKAQTKEIKNYKKENYQNLSNITVN